MNKLQSIRGMHDVLPDHSPVWQWLERELRSIATRYDFREIRTPIVENIEVFTRAIGQTTDVVEKEMYAFPDRNEDLLALRPEGTAGVVRSAIQHGLLHTPGLKVWYAGPMFRHERPQKGRQRQFFQFGAEVFGLESAATDVELILMVEQIWRALGLRDRVELQINTLGDKADRERYRALLLDYLEPFRAELDEDSQRRLERNPLRIFDSKHPATQAIMADAPRLSDHLGEEAQAHFDDVLRMLDALAIPYRVNTGLVRGLDYYCRTVFEWVSGDLGAQGTVCAGGRYDDLVEMQGGKATPGIGFAMGIERVIGLLEAAGRTVNQTPDAFIVSRVDPADMLRIGEQLRAELPHLTLAASLAGGSFKAQFKRADRSGARFAIVLGPDELAQGVAQVKDMRADEAVQETVELDKLAGWIGSRIDPSVGD
jgi:histidyl-tRNA synthetase